MNQEYYRERWQHLSLHPLQSLDWMPVYSNSKAYICSDIPTLVRFSINPLNKRPFATIHRGGYDKLNAQDWQESLTQQLLLDQPMLTHITIEPNGTYASNSQMFSHHEVEPINAQHTVVNSLLADEDELLSIASKSHRQNVRKALKRGLEVASYSSGSEALERFKAVMASIETSQAFVQFKPEHYSNVWNTMSAANQAYISIGTYDGQDVGAYLVVHNGHTAFQFYGGRTDIGRRERLAQGLAYKTMVSAKQYGCEFYDMWGIGAFDEDGLIESDEKYGIGQFKCSFGGEKLKHGDTLTHIIDTKGFKRYQSGKKLAKLKLRLHKKLKR